MPCSHLVIAGKSLRSFDNVEVLDIFDDAKLFRVALAVGANITKLFRIWASHLHNSCRSLAVLDLAV